MDTGRISKIVNFHPIDLKFEVTYLVIEVNQQLFLRSNLFYGFCKYRAVHNIFFLSYLFVNRLQVTILNRSSQNFTKL